MTPQQMIDRVLAGHYSADELLELHKNCLSKDVPELLDAIYFQLWKHHPAKARKRFGPKGEKAQSLLDGVAEDMQRRFELGDNRLGGHVKVGGLVRAEDKYFLDLYISYKRQDGEGIALSLLQKDVDTEPFARIRRYRTGKDAAEDTVDYPIGAWPEVVERYEALLSEIAPRR